MPRRSAASILAEKYKNTMIKCSSFDEWADKYLRNGDKVKFKKAYESLKKSEKLCQKDS